MVLNFFSQSFAVNLYSKFGFFSQTVLGFVARVKRIPASVKLMDGTSSRMQKENAISQLPSAFIF